MLFTYLALAFAILGFLGGAFALFRAETAVNGSVAMGKWVQANNKASVTLKRLADIETELTELKDAYDTLIESHKKLRSRIGMRRLRDSQADQVKLNGAPPSDPAGKLAYKQKLREDCRSKGLIR